MAGQMHDPVQGVSGEDRGYGVGVGAVTGVPRQVDAVRGGDSVQRDHVVPAVHEADREDLADAPGGAGDEYAHD
jgi:hypothetical protein